MILRACMVMSVAAWCAGCEQRVDYVSQHGEHAAHAGNVVSLGRDQYHAAVVLDRERTLRLFTLGADATRVLTVPEQFVTVYVRDTEGTVSTTLKMLPQRQAGDAPGRTSQFAVDLPADFVAERFEVEIPNIAFGYDRFRIATKIGDAEHSGMPPTLSPASERQLFLTARGRYSDQDIAANGWKVPSEVYQDFMPQHDANPGAGERLCPITETKANADCVWTIDGKVYEFCCPPCIGELVKLAKERPDELRLPDEFVKTGE